MTRAHSSPLSVKDASPGAVLVVALSLLATIALLVWVLGRCRYGIDLTDESFYLAWMRDPSRYRASVLLFGFLYRPLYELCGGNVALLRQLNVLLTVALAGLACFSLLRGTAPEGRVLAPLAVRLALSTVLAASALLLFQVWLPTPSYNGLALHALALAATGMVLAEKEATRSSLAGWVVMGLAGWLAYMAKPTTAAALAMVVLAYLLAARKVNGRLLGLAAAVAIAGLLATALVIDGSIAAHVSRLEHGAEMLRLLDAGHTLSNLVRVEGAASRVARGASPGRRHRGGVPGHGAGRFQQHRRPGGRPRVQRAGRALCAGADLRVVDARSRTAGRRGPAAPGRAGRAPPGQPVGAASRPCVAARRARAWRWASRWAPCLSSTPSGRAPTTGPAHPRRPSSGSWPRSPWFAAVPRVALAHAGPGRLWALAVTVVLLAMAMEHPTRQPRPLRLDRWPAELRPPGHPLLVSEEVGVYLSQSEQAAQKGGFRVGDPVIDLTGHAPGALYTLGARALGQPWIIGGYPGARPSRRRPSTPSLVRTWPAPGSWSKSAGRAASRWTS